MTEQIKQGFRRIGLSEAEAKIAARGRDALPATESLAEGARRLGLSHAASQVFARGRSDLREVVKNVAGLPSSCFAWVTDPQDPTTWKLQIARTADEGTEWSPDEDLVRAAAAQVPGIAGYGNALDIPAADLPAVKATLYSAWIACGAPIDEMPRELSQEALRVPFKRLGITSEAGLRAAMRGRERSSS